MSKTLIVELPAADDIRKALRALPEVAVSNNQASRNFWTCFMSALASGPDSQIAMHAKWIQEFTVAAYVEGSAHFGESGGHADFLSGKMKIRIGYLGAEYAHRNEPSFFLSVDCRDCMESDEKVRSLFMGMLMAIVADPNPLLAKAPATFADPRGSMTVAMALIYCLLPLTH